MLDLRRFVDEVEMVVRSDWKALSGFPAASKRPALRTPSAPLNTAGAVVS
jgi:hypothetical protein